MPDSDNRLGYYLSGAISTLISSQFESMYPAALNPTSSVTNKVFVCLVFFFAFQYYSVLF